MSENIESVEDVEYVVRVKHEDDDSYWAEVLDLPGCFASGDTLDELMDALREAISLYLSDETEAVKIVGAKVAARPMEVGEMRVKVPA